MKMRVGDAVLMTTDVMVAELTAAGWVKDKELEAWSPPGAPYILYAGLSDAWLSMDAERDRKDSHRED